MARTVNELKDELVARSQEYHDKTKRAEAQFERDRNEVYQTLAQVKRDNRQQVEYFRKRLDEANERIQDLMNDMNPNQRQANQLAMSLENKLRQQSDKEEWLKTENENLRNRLDEIQSICAQYQEQIMQLSQDLKKQVLLTMKLNNKILKYETIIYGDGEPKIPCKRFMKHHKLKASSPIL